MTITAQQVHEAADLLADREELLEDMQPLLKAKRVRVEIHTSRTYTITSMGHPRNGETETVDDWVRGPEVPLTAATRKVLCSALFAQLAEIDAKLRALGVEPPRDETDTPASPSACPANGELPL